MIMHVVGNRPQLIKLAPLSRELRRRRHPDIIIHTGQHYDQNMSDIFFQELGIEPPYRNLMVGSGSHGYITGKALIELEKVMLELRPEIVIVYGDTNSTVAAALSAVKLDIPVVHVEAGPRTYVKNNPEEINRIIVDHISKVLCCPDQASVYNLERENIVENVYFTGDIMYDTYLYSRERETDEVLLKYGVQNGQYILMTWHRQENTDERKRMEKILNFIQYLDVPVLCPMHPRTRKMLERYNLWEEAAQIPHFKIVEPVGYMEMISLMNNSKFILCDSGGVSKESYFAGKKCLFMLDFCPWKELVENGSIMTINFEDEDDWEKKVEEAKKMGERTACSELLFGNGRTAEKIVDILEDKFSHYL